MLNPEPDHKPIIGDDGELIEPDTLVDDEQYDYYVWGDLPEPTFSTHLRDFIRNNFGIILVSVLVFLAATPFISGLVLKCNPSTHVTKPVSTPRPTAPNTIKKTLPPLDARYLPSSGNWSDTYSSLPVTRVKWSPDGNTVAYQKGDETIAFLGLRVYESWINTEQALSYFDWMPDGQDLVGIHHPMTGSSLDPVLSVFGIPGSDFNMQPVNSQPDFIKDALPELLATSPQNITAIVSRDGFRISIINHNRFRWMATRRSDSPVHDLDWIGDGSWYSLVTEIGIWKWLPAADIPFEVLKGNYQQVSWSPDGQDIAVTQLVNADFILSRIHPHDQIRWNRTLPRPVRSSNAFNPQVEWSPDGQRIATFIRGESTIDLWDAQTGNPVLHFNSRSPIIAIDWSPEGKYLAIGTDIGLTLWSPN